MSEEHRHEHSHEHHHHGHVHSAAEKKAVINRISRAIGQLESITRMIDRDEDCSQVVLKNHISECIVEAVEHNDREAIEELGKAIDSFVK